MSVINALVDAGHSHESEIFQTVMQAYNAETTRLRQQLDIALKAFELQQAACSVYAVKTIGRSAIAQIRELGK